MTPYRQRRHDGHYDAPQEASPEAEEAPAETPEAELDDTQPQEEAVMPLSEMTKAELITLCRDRDISPANAAMSKSELITALEAN